MPIAEVEPKVPGVSGITAIMVAMKVEPTVDCPLQAVEAATTVGPAGITPIFATTTSVTSFRTAQCDGNQVRSMLLVRNQFYTMDWQEVGPLTLIWVQVEESQWNSFFRKTTAVSLRRKCGLMG